MYTILGWFKIKANMTLSQRWCEEKNTKLRWNFKNEEWNKNGTKDEKDLTKCRECSLSEVFVYQLSKAIVVHHDRILCQVA